MSKMRIALAAAVSLFLTHYTASIALAEGGAGPEAMSMGNMCMVMFGYDMIHITAYQPGKSRSEYCEEIPSTGKTIFSFDIANPSYRDLPIEVRFVRDPLTPISSGTDLESITEFSVPAKKYSKGTFLLEHEFKANGHYIGLVTVTRPDGKQEMSQYKFMIGETLWSWVPQIAGAILIAGCVFVYFKHSNTTSKKDRVQTSI